MAQGFVPALLGFGIPTGITSFGAFGRVHKDVTTIGQVVNLAARLQAAAQPAEVLTRAAVFEKLDGDRAAVTRACSLKGYAEPMNAYLI